MILADKIILLRKKSGWSQEELAEKFMQNKERNKNYLNQNNKEQTIWCDHGVDQYLEK